MGKLSSLIMCEEVLSYVGSSHMGNVVEMVQTQTPKQKQALDS